MSGKKNNKLQYDDEVFSDFTINSEKPFPNSYFDEFSGMKIHYRIWGDISKSNSNTKKILLGHGLGGSTYSWNKISEKLKGKNYLAVAPDYPNFGYSERVMLKYDPRVFADILCGLMEKIDGQIAAFNGTGSDNTKEKKDSANNKWHLAAHSTSGFIMTCLATSKYDSIGSIAYVAPAISKNILRNFLFGAPLLSGFIKKKIKSSITTSGITGFLNFAYSKEPSPEDVFYYYHPLTLDNSIDCLHYMLSKTEQPGVKNAKNNFASIDSGIPTAIIWGDQDNINPLRKSKQLLKLKPNSRLEIIKNCGHCPMETDPDRFYSLLTDFYKLNNR